MARQPSRARPPHFNRHTTVPKPDRSARSSALRRSIPRPASPGLQAHRRPPTETRQTTVPRTTKAPKRDVGRLIDEEDATLLDLIDNLLNKGVVLNADVILALANVDLVYLRISALLCAADRVMPRREV